MITDPKKIRSVLITDCGSTTTKALLLEKQPEGWRQTFRGEAPTTVEDPIANVTVGAKNAFREVQELSNRQILCEEPVDAKDSPDLKDEKNLSTATTTPFPPHPFKESEEDSTQGIDLYLSTSSAGGGLQMMVAGVVRHMTAESATRAALGAGAIVLDVVSADDGREDHQRIERMRHLRPDILLITGGVDGGSRAHVIEIAETVLAASPRPRFGDTLRLPIVYAGNRDAAKDVTEILSRIGQVTVVENVRPTIEHENLIPAREAIHEFFLNHVMSHSPGYGELLSWSPVPILPTPAAVGDMVQNYAKSSGLQILCADIGGATTDIFSVFRDQGANPIFNRTVSANLGMSYSIANVLSEAGVDAIARWLPYKISSSDVRDRLRNKMIRPTTIPETLEDLWLEQAVCREALRLSLTHHRSLAVGLTGSQKKRGIAEIFRQSSNRYDLVNLMELDLVIGSGGVLSHAPHRLGAALMMMDGFGLEGVTELTVDSIFMMPHLGVFSKIHPEAAHEIFLRDCIVRIAHGIAPVYPPQTKGVLCEVKVEGVLVGEILPGVVKQISLPERAEVTLEVIPKARKIQIGGQLGESYKKQIKPGQFGLLLDGRNRPIVWPTSEEERIQQQQNIFQACNILGGGK